MAEVNSTATSELAAAPAPPEPQVYRPVSMLAVSGLVLAVIYVAMVVVAAGVGFFAASPVFLPVWTLLLAFAAAGLCVLGQRQIRDSEGTRAGLTLARWGLVLSIFSGLGYAAYQYFTGLAIVQQANDFLMVRDDADSGFFPRLQSGDPAEINRAFLLTMPENVRSAVDPNDTRKMEQMFNRGRGPKSPEGPLGQFRDNFLIRSIARNGADAKIDVLGVQKWVFEKGSYIVRRNYRITMPEITVEFVLPVQSSEGEQRKWLVAFPQMDFKKADLSPLGVALVNASLSARMFVSRNAVQTPWKDMLDKTDWPTVTDDEPWKPIREHIIKMFGPDVDPAHRVQSPPSKNVDKEIPPWQVVNGRLRFTLDVKYNLPDPAGFPWMGDGVVVVEDQKPVALDAAGHPEPESLKQEARWKLVSIEFRHLSSMQKMMERKMPPPK